MTEQNTDNQLQDDSEDKAPKSKKGLGCFKLFLVVGIFGLAALMALVFVLDKMNIGLKTKVRDFVYKVVPPPKYAPPPPKIVERIVEKEKIVEKIVEVEVKPPPPPEYVSWQKIDTAKLWSGIKVATAVHNPQGGLASQAREQDAYQIQMRIVFNSPTPSSTIGELAQMNSHLPDMLPKLGHLISLGKVSPFFHELYSNKTSRIQQKMTRFDQLLSVHNLYDTETVLELEDPETKQKALLIQSDMDVVSDGSDGDRWPFLDNYVSMSQYYQPFTSYGWAKRTGTPNPLLERFESELEKHTKEFAIPGLSIERNRFLRARITELTKQVSDIKARSYLIAEADPFIVMSLAFLGHHEKTEWGPMIGDYAVVIHENNVYPAIVGDAGPSFKFGEASLRLAREINPNATPYNRPVSDLGITYLVFPQSREEKNSPPDLDQWHAKCAEYLGKIGGLGQGYQLHQWEDIVPKKLEEWKAQNPGAVIVDQPLEQMDEEPDFLPTPSFSAPKGSAKGKGTGKSEGQPATPEGSQ